MRILSIFLLSCFLFHSAFFSPFFFNQSLHVSHNTHLSIFLFNYIFSLPPSPPPPNSIFPLYTTRVAPLISVLFSLFPPFFVIFIYSKY
jgi:hypothetical protein